MASERSSISPRDEAALTWYFRDGERRFQRSTHGAIVARLERDSAGCTPCRVCDGVGILEDDAAVDRHKRRGKSTERRHTWVVVEERKDVGGTRAGPILVETEAEIWAPVGVGSFCQLCEGTGVRPKSRPKPRCPDCIGLQRWQRQRCTTCHGSGRVSYDVREGAGHEEAGGIEVDGDTLRRFAVISRRLAQIRVAHRDVLERYFGPRGQYWAGHNAQAGRLVALQATTNAGRTLLRKTRTKGDEATGATPEQRIDAQWALQVRDPKTWRYELLDESLRQAGERFVRAAEAWRGIEVTPGWRDTLNHVLARIDLTAGRVEAWNDEFRSTADWARQGADGVYR